MACVADGVMPDQDFDDEHQLGRAAASVISRVRGAENEVIVAEKGKNYKQILWKQNLSSLDS